MAEPWSEAKRIWIEKPVGANEWALDIPPPDKRNFVEFLENELGIEELTQQQGLWSAITFSSADLLVDELKRPDNRTLRRRLKQIDGYADKLLGALASLERSSTSPSSEEKSLDEWLVRILLRTDATQSQNSLAHTLTSLKQLKRATELSESFLSQSGAGRRKDQTLWLWVKYLEAVWSLTTGKPATIDYHDGIPITPYARFMHRAIDMLDPERAPRLQNVLVRYRTQQNRTESGPDYTQ